MIFSFHSVGLIQSYRWRVKTSHQASNGVTGHFMDLTGVSGYHQRTYSELMIVIALVSEVSQPLFNRQ